MRRRVKLELRKRMRGLRKALPEQACAERSGRIADRLLALAPFEEARAVALFWPMHSHHEVDLRALSSALQARGRRIAFPRIDPASGAMTFHFVLDSSALVEGGLGLHEPSPGEPQAAAGELDAIVVPALAVDPRGHRIGYGRGYYDRALPTFSPPAATFAVAFDFQLVAEVPNTEGDVPVGWVVTDARTLVAEPAA